MGSCYILPSLVLNSWPQAILLPQPPKALGLQARATVSSLSKGTHGVRQCQFLGCMEGVELSKVPAAALLRRLLALSPGWSVVAQSRLTATSASWVEAILPPQPPDLEPISILCWSGVAAALGGVCYVRT
ncbi:hypothetical protein AAY473_036007 [Plecturocebus cupreus]